MMAKPKSELVTVLFTDIVGSTQLAGQLGDKRWRVLLTRHNAALRRELKRHRGHEVDTAGDGFFATFSRPADAIRCASVARQAMRELGVEIRAGVHMGECEVIGKKVGGMTVHIGARTLGVAAPGEILVTGTVRDLVVGAGFEFAERGDHELKGVPGSWHLLAIAAIDGSPVPPLLDQLASAELRSQIKAPPLLERRAGRVAALSVIGVLVLGGILVLLVARGRGSHVPPPVDRLVRIDPETGKVVATLPLGGNPAGVATGAGAVWVVDASNDLLLRVDPVSNRIVARITVGRHPSSVAVGGAVGQEAVWVTNELDDTVWKVDPASNMVTAKLPAGVDHPDGVIVGEGWVWVHTSVTNQVARFDPSTGEPGGSFPMCCSLAVGYGSVWIGSSSLLRMNVQDLSLQHDGYDGVQPACGISIGESAVWVCGGGSILYDIDPSSDQIRSHIGVGHDPDGVVTGSDSVWLANSDGTLVWVRTATDSVAGTIQVGKDISGVAVGAGALWVTVDVP